MAKWGFKNVSKKKMPTARVIKSIMNKSIEAQLPEVGREAVAYAKRWGAPRETGSLRDAQAYHSGVSRKGPWLTAGWDVTRLQRTSRQTWSALRPPRKPKGTGSASAILKNLEATKTIGGGRRRTFTSTDGKWFDYGTYQYGGRDWRSGRPLHYRQGGKDHWYLQWFERAHARYKVERTMRVAMIEAMDRIWSAM